MRIEWIPEYNLGIERVDEQHQWLVKLYNNIDNAKSRNSSAEIIGTYMKGLIHYTRFHFSAEEGELRKVNYTSFNEHKQMHEHFINKINQFLYEFENGNQEIVNDVLDYLKDWLIGHIMREDKKYVPFVKGATSPLQTAALR